MTAGSKQAMRDAGLLLLVIVLAATVRITPPQPVTGASWIPETRAASALPIVLDDAASPSLPPATSVAPALDLDFDLGFAAPIPGQRIVLRRTAAGATEDATNCPTRLILIRTNSSGDTAEAPVVVPAPDPPRVQELRITRRHSGPAERGCTT